MQHALKHVERPGGNHTALDGKKILLERDRTASAGACSCIGHWALVLALAGLRASFSLEWGTARSSLLPRSAWDGVPLSF